MSDALRHKAGVPTAEDFADSAGGPVIVDTTNGDLYIINDASSVIKIGTMSAINTNSAQMTSADNALSNAISVLSTNYTSLVNRVSANSAAAASITSAEYTSLVDRVSANSAVGGGGSVSSAEHASVDARVSANSAQMTSADNAISAAVVALSAQHTSLAASVAGALSAIAANSAQMKSADDAISGAVVALSAQHTSLAASVAGALSAIGANSAQMVSADNAISAVAADALSAARAASANITSVLSNQLSGVKSAVSANSAQMTSADNAISAAVVALSAQHTSLANSVAGALSAIAANSAELTSVKGYGLNNLSGVSVDSPADGQVVAWNSGQAQWVATTPSGGGSVSSAEHQSVVDIVSGWATSGALAALPVKRVLAGNQVLAATAPVSVSGFTFTCSAGVGYGFEFGIYTSNPVSLAGNKFVLSVPSSAPLTMQYLQGGCVGGVSTLNVDRTNVTMANVTVSAVGVPIACYARGTFRCSANGGTMQLAMGSNTSGSTAGSQTTVLAGSYGYLWRMV